MGCIDLSSSNHEWRIRVLKYHHTNTATKTVTQALALLRRKPHKGDPSHRGYLRMSQQASRLTIFDIFKPSTS